MDRRPLWQALHDVGLAAWFGGAWMGAVGLNGATIEVDDHTQRTRVANAGWFRWAPIAGAALVANVVGAGVLGRLGVDRHGLDRGAPALAHVRTVLTGIAALATLETGISGNRVVAGGDVPVASAVHPVRATPDDVARAQRRLRVAQWAVPASTGALLLLEALQSTSGGAQR